MNNNKQLNEKLCMNSLILQKIATLTSEERQDTVKHLIEVSGKSERKLAEELGISHTTLNGWKTGKVKDKTFHYMKLDNIITKFIHFVPKDQQDIDKLIQIRELIDEMIKDGTEK